MTMIGPMEPVTSSGRLMLSMTYGVFLPEFFISEDQVRESAVSLGHNVLKVDVDSLIGFRKIIVQFHPATSAEAGVIGKQLADAIRERLWAVWDVTADKYELGSGEPIFDTQTTISIASIALLAVVGVAFVIYIGGRK